MLHTYCLMTHYKLARNPRFIIYLRYEPRDILPISIGSILGGYFSIYPLSFYRLQ